MHKQTSSGVPQIHSNFCTYQKIRRIPSDLATIFAHLARVDTVGCGSLLSWLDHCLFELCVLVNPLNPEINPICYLLALLGAHNFLHISRVRVKLLTFKLLMSFIYIYIYIYGAPILDVSRSHTTTQHSR